MRIIPRLLVISLVLITLGAGCLAKTTVTTGNVNTTVTTQLTTNNPTTGTFTTNSSVVNGSVSVTASAISITDFTFTPANLTIKKGTVVTWTNNGQTMHTVDITGSASSGDLNHGQTFSHTFSSTGSFSYHCAHHGTMLGLITVTE